MRVAFCRAAIDMNLAPGEVLVAAHAHPLRTEGDAVGVEFDALFIEQMRIGFLAVFGEWNHGRNFFFFEIAVMGLGVMVAVAAKDGDVEIESVFPGSF